MTSKDAAQVFKILGDENRLRIVCSLLSKKRYALVTCSTLLT